MQQQRLLAPGADAWHLVEHRAQAGLGPPGAVGADGEAVRLVAQALEEVERRVARLQHEGGLAGQEDALAPGVTVGALGDGGDRQVAEAEVGQHLAARSEEHTSELQSLMRNSYAV